MKKKILVFTLCFTLIFSSLNYKKSYADGGVISLPMLATVSALAVGTGIIINNNDDLFDLGRVFYDYVDKHNDLTWATVQSVFTSSVSLQSNKLVSVKSEFLDIVKNFLDDTFGSSSGDVFIGGTPIYPTFSKLDYGVFGNYKVLKENGSYPYAVHVLMDDGSWTRIGAFSNLVTDISFEQGSGSSHLVYTKTKSGVNKSTFKALGTLLFSVGCIAFPYEGGYTWDNVNDRLNENDELPLPIPGDLGHLVGQGSGEFWGNTDNLVGDGVISAPDVSNPSIGLGGITSFPSVDSDVGVGNPSVPNEGIWSTVKDFIIGFVVPSDTYWTDTWGGLYNNFTNSFPMVDMDGFNDLVTGEKKFPNIDINIMGVTGRVVNGDVINSIVDWLRPIIAGFMMLCLMLFNYRKIYKLIRNSEPFGGIAPGTSDFSTGISEYSKQEVVKATDMVAEYRAWRERGGK